MEHKVIYASMPTSMHCLLSAESIHGELVYTIIINSKLPRSQQLEVYFQEVEFIENNEPKVVSPSGESWLC